MKRVFLIAAFAVAAVLGVSSQNQIQAKLPVPKPACDASDGICYVIKRGGVITYIKPGLMVITIED